MQSRTKLAFALTLLLVASHVQAESNRITMSFDGVPLSRAANELIAQAGLSFGIPPDPVFYNRKGLGIQIRDVPVDVALKAFAVAYEVCLRQSGQIINIMKCTSGTTEYR